jgi:hypothetical protein
MAANNSIACTVTDGDPDHIEDLSDNLEQLLIEAAKDIADRIPELSSDYGTAPDGIDLIRFHVREILMENVYLKIMMPT